MIMLVPALPIIGIVWCLVKLTSRGPGFYSQHRTGLRGRNFRIHKIRTMSWNCESGTGAIWASRNDPRVTPLGRFLRATHLDELPQIFNVLNGEMALVGPRPERPEIIERLLPEIPDYLDRLAVLPGVTGLAQVCTGADQSLDDVRLKLRYDQLYIERKSAWLNLRIIICTGLKMAHLNSRWVRTLLLPEALPIARQSRRMIHEFRSRE
jgi:lipopolysaccharide/colanic/teichoic acid biosynthesis glycosyltransferase